MACGWAGGKCFTCRHFASHYAGMVSTTFERLFVPPKGSFFLLGIRGVGKSTLARALFPRARRFDLLSEQAYQSYLTQPDLFALALQAERPGATVVVDEIQRLPNLLNEVHRAIESHGLRFALLGSSARKLKAAGTNLLAGRAVKRELFPLTPHELATEFDLGRVLRLGSIPLVVRSSDPEDALRAYVELYLKEEIRSEALVRNLPAFSRFFPIAALFHGQVINTLNIARESGVARTTVQGYLEILDDTLLTMRLSAFQAKLRVRERSLPKLYWVDAGLARAATRLSGPPSREEAGRLFEGYVLTVLRAYNARRSLFDDVHYWGSGDRNAFEVDFVLQRGKELVAIEVKSTNRFSDQLCKGIRAFDAHPRVARRIVVYTGKERLATRDGIEVLPFLDFCALLHDGKL
jgi:predicted AAA+ superfamily ATPase